MSLLKRLDQLFGAFPHEVLSALSQSFTPRHTGSTEKEEPLFLKTRCITLVEKLIDINDLELLKTLLYPCVPL